MAGFCMDDTDCSNYITAGLVTWCIVYLNTLLSIQRHQSTQRHQQDNERFLNILPSSLFASILQFDSVPNVEVKRSTLLLRIQEVLDSNLGPDTCYPVWASSWFSSIPSGECLEGALKLGHDRFLPNPFQFIIHLSPSIRRCRVLVTENASLNKLQIII
jgi:hypothetical protein